MGDAHLHQNDRYMVVACSLVRVVFIRSVIVSMV